ncbi:ROK family protein [Leifsonia sp. F6_8S_P_1B]|uniref:ROK family protein n=2 Tax=Leifsonia williamsii TaxID=3035919 RepID=A0ABT8K7B1_9MICO|nr:ROK family protein [Leifsonia williamsii]MDN4613343.1 ROK family protein [Leifsonia williamsii]
MANGRRAVLSLDIGGTKLAVGVVTEDGRTHGLVVEPTRREEGPGVIVPRLFDMGHRAIAASGIPAHDIEAVGISCGGPLDARAGVLTGPLHLPGWIDLPIVALAEREFGVPAALENDATAGALGEFRYGAARAVETMVYLTISTGIGGGAVIEGRLHRGAAGNGGEFGHLMVRTGGRHCLCGRDGCLEMYASGTSIAARAREALADRGARSSLATLETVRAEDVVAAAAAGDALATEVWDKTIDLLGVAVTDLVNVFEPDLVVLGGGVTRSGDALLLPLRERVASAAMPPAAAAARIVLAELGDVVCVVGAGAVAFDKVASLATALPTRSRTAKEVQHG